MFGLALGGFTMHCRSTGCCGPLRPLIGFTALVKEELGTMTTTANENMLKLQYQVCWEYRHQQAIVTRHSRDYSLGSYSGPSQ